MIQVNLLPEVKLEYLKATRMKRMVVTIGVIASTACIFMLVLLVLEVNVRQRAVMRSIDEEITQSSKDLSGKDNLNKILTVQNQLSKVSSLHAQKPVVSRTFNFVSQMTPLKVTISNLEVNYADAKMKIEGTADTVETINKYTDTIKFTDMKTANTPNRRAFSGVVLTSFAKTDAGTSFTIDARFDAQLFASEVDTTLVVPQIITTRSSTEKPLFDQQKTN